VSLFASGSEVEIAVAAQKRWRNAASRRGWSGALARTFAFTAGGRRKAIIGNAPVKVAIEAAVRWGGCRDRPRMVIRRHARFRRQPRPQGLFKHFELPPRLRLTLS